MVVGVEEQERQIGHRRVSSRARADAGPDLDRFRFGFGDRPENIPSRAG
jgi:hypothetical protein